MLTSMTNINTFFKSRWPLLCSRNVFFTIFTIKYSNKKRIIPERWFSYFKVQRYRYYLFFSDVQSTSDVWVLRVYNVNLGKRLKKSFLVIAYLLNIQKGQWHQTIVFLHFLSWNCVCVRDCWIIRCNVCMTLARK